ncbi:unnamed protein product [Arabidopsis lyrata]|uniref:Uncharacterized protein n=1 Tax=Arabidopsis lyrata subsp. lyrata TaxID=81972 RepID=D7KYV6_ARALL|nr:uncharacterized protein LOC9324900 [Arabidopsis lyrata subsp. lyrata]EFH63632.1 hypothetical protein ARALYDRAFT_894991 [Arabidopsis lyrata subsp. lyrata]CAH8257842.1 unnamed protein product [Arabidopsis lyrata]|eukprot:XP_002887373.1 uncharacterized protein LOC9324900 [Arabidopsis lyrata subsp. lyrata]
MEGKENCKDLLKLELKNPSSSSAMDSALLMCTEKNRKKKSEAPPPSKPTIAPVPKSQLLGKLKGFLGVMAEANKKSEANPEAYNIEALTGNESEVIEMDLMLGVADLNTPEAVSAAEAAIAGIGPAAESGDSSSDESDSDSDGEENKSEEECSRKPAKIIELS